MGPFRLQPVPFAIALTALGPVAAAASSPDFPPPGEYRIDTETTRRLHSPAGRVESIERVDGATGNASITQRAPGMVQPVVSQVPGSGPVLHCQGLAGPPPTRTHCRAHTDRSGGQTVVETNCAGHPLRASFRQLGDGIWEQRHHVPPGPNGMEIDSVQRWTRVASHCSSRR
ncbi:MAG: hypothetical protein ACOZJX_14145 [Pseudomonadota bacterium]